MQIFTLLAFTLLAASLLALSLAVDPACESGLKSGTICCPRECGTCGGPGCGVRSRATKTLCCKGAIRNRPDNCLTSDGPCKITAPEGFKAGSDTPDPECAKGLLTRKACCPAECSTCGGTGCKARGRLLKSDCCVSSIKKKIKSCRLTGPPCLVTEMTSEPEVSSMPVATPEMSPTASAMPLPEICHVKMRPIGGCFCFVTLNKIISIRKRYKFVKICVEQFGRRTVNRMADECKKYTEGDTNVKELVDEVNLLIPQCYPPNTPLVVFKP